MWATFFVVCGLCILIVQTKKASYGPWKAVINHIGPCVSDQYKDLHQSFEFNVQKKDKYNRYMTEGKIYLPSGVTNDFNIAAVVSERKNDKWHAIIDQEMGPACKVFNTYKSALWELIVENANLTTFKVGDELCLTKVAAGEIKDFELPPVDIQGIPKFFYGDYLGEIRTSYQNRTKFTCTAFSYSVIPAGNLKR